MRWSPTATPEQIARWETRKGELDALTSTPDLIRFLRLSARYERDTNGGDYGRLLSLAADRLEQTPQSSSFTHTTGFMTAPDVIASPRYPTFVHEPAKPDGLPSYTVWAQFTMPMWASDRDMELEMLSPVPPDSWLAEEDLSLILFGTGTCHVESGEGWIFGVEGTDRALRFGVAPYQPFAVRVDCTYSWDSYNHESDACFDTQLVAVEPLTSQQAAHRFTQWHERFDTYRSRAVAEMRALLELQRSDISAMSICEDEIHPDGWFGRRRIIRLTLRSAHRELRISRKSCWGTLVEIRYEDLDGRGGRDAAWNLFRARVAEELPHVTLGALPIRRR